ncbi:helix-turn-helix domain-containing protein [Streptomyces sp. NPDC014802]|uniref:helix-turn-helix domain-containing protein n=1 Tax=Streptomyces sp. NPDC014802 TaxID=3364917 RepID=UPI003701252A
MRDGTPLRELAFWLRDLRTGSGLTYARLAARSGYSVSTLQEAAAGRRLPTLAVTVAFARACGADQAAWHGYWTQVRRAVDSGSPVAPVPPWGAGTAGTREETERPGSPGIPEQPCVTRELEASQESRGPDPGELVGARELRGPGPDELPGPDASRPTSHHPATAGAVDELGPPQSAVPPRSKARTVRIAAASGLLLMAVGVPGGLWLALSPDRPAHRDFASVVVQNKVAIGPTALVEDKTPAYLSSETISHCAARGCKLVGTEMWSGAKLVVFCWTRGEKLTNEDITSAGITSNKGGVTSDLWYRAKWKDGRSGYFPEVYLAPAGRGGSGLAHCTG